MRLRRLAVTVDRPDFLVNPTNCDPLKIAGVITSTSGTPAAVSSPFHVGGCDKLGFSPKLAMRFTGGKAQTAKRKHPGLVATVTPVAGQANLKTTTVTLPASITLDANNLPVLCDLADAQKRACKQSSAVGTAKVTTPLVNGPLTGPVYLVNGGPGGLPSLLAALSGPIDISVHADSAFTGKHVVTKFTGLPDAPLSSFVLTITGGSKGILVATRSLCSKNNNTSAVEGAQNGRTHRASVRVGVTCPKKSQEEGVIPEWPAVPAREALTRAAGGGRRISPSAQRARRRSARASRARADPTRRAPRSRRQRQCRRAGRSPAPA